MDDMEADIAQNGEKEKETTWWKDLSWMELAKRVGTFLVLTAMAATADVSFDIYAAVIYFYGGLMIFGSVAVVILCVSPICVWLFLYSNDAKHGPLWKYFTTVEIWEKAWESVKNGKQSFDLAFVALGEACLEAFPTSIIQQFSVMSKMVGVEGRNYYILRGSIVSSLLLMSKTLTGFDFYGRKNHTWAEYLLQGCFRVGEVGARTLSMSHFWLLLRPRTENNHGFTAYHMPPLILISFLANIILLRRYLSNLPLSQIVIWATLLMLASPPNFLTKFNRVRLGFWVYRALEFIIMVFLVWRFGDSPMQRIWENAFFVYVLAACVMLIVISYAAQLCSLSQEYQTLSGSEQGQEPNVDPGPLNSAVLENDVPLARLFSRLFDLNEPDLRGKTPLNYVRSPEMLQVLTDAGAEFSRNTTDDDVKELARNCKGLHLTNTKLPDTVTDIGYKELAKNCAPDLSNIDLSGNRQIGDETVQEIAQCCKNLSAIYLRDTKVTDDGVKELKAKIPGIKIYGK